MKRPSFQFYPSDWLRDTALRTCSIGARGLWMDMICYMHEGNPYGYLKVGNKVILADNLAPMVGSTLDDVEGWLHELSDAGVFDVVDGIICSRRMIRDEELRQKRAEGGKLGGNPILKDKGKVNLEVKQNPTPSSSSSSSSSSSKKQKTTDVVMPEGISQSVWDEFIAHRKAKKAKVTQLVIESIGKEASKAGWTLEDALKETIVRNWQSFKADWVQPKQASNSGFIGKPDVATMTTPTPANHDAALKKIIEDDKKAAPMPSMVRELAMKWKTENDKSRSTQNS